MSNIKNKIRSIVIINKFFEVSENSDIIENTTKKIISYWDLNPKNLFLKLKSNISTPKYMKDAVPLLTDMQFRWIEDH
jgi:hypothetical protein